MTRSPVRSEFLLLMAAMMCLMALYIDAMLPALYQIGVDFDALEGNHYQMVITSVMIGMGVGQLFYGPFSDAFGRKPAVYLGFSLILIGTLISIFAQSFEWMLLGRLLQGLGAAGPRVMMVAIIRDCYSGPDMARVMSLVMTIFIFSPVVAPLVGQLVLLFAGWRAVFVLLLTVSLATVIWFGLRQNETLTPENTREFSLRPILRGTQTVLAHREALIYTFAGGLIHGALIGFLTSIQAILQDIYQTGAMFPVYFALMAIGVAVSSFINSRLVYHFSLRNLVMGVLLFLSSVALVEAGLVAKFDAPSLWLFILMMSVSTFCFGLLFANLNSLAMEPFGHLAGLASGTIGALTMMIGVIIGSLIGLSFNGTLVPMLLGFGLSALIALLLIRFAANGRRAEDDSSEAAALN
ncbi:MAG TPA: multidrug effflux MFS transporter [Marinobacterium sp.]|nr:multidrug effflux MFS transporter [Marinobacterium sp.]